MTAGRSICSKKSLGRGFSQAVWGGGRRAIRGAQHSPCYERSRRQAWIRVPAAAATSSVVERGTRQGRDGEGGKEGQDRYTSHCGRQRKEPATGWSGPSRPYIEKDAILFRVCSESLQCVNDQAELAAAGRDVEGSVPAVGDGNGAPLWWAANDELGLVEVLPPRKGARALGGLSLGKLLHVGHRHPPEGDESEGSQLEG